MTSPARGPSRARTVAAGVLLVFVALVLGSGCGQDEVGAYCQELDSQRTALADMTAATSTAALLDGLPRLEDLAAEAPPDLTDEWGTFLDAVRGLAEAVEKSGHPVEDFGGEALPADLTPEQKREITDAATLLLSPEVEAASRGIEQQARDVCKINIGL